MVVALLEVKPTGDEASKKESFQYNTIRPPASHKNTPDFQWAWHLEDGTDRTKPAVVNNPDTSKFSITLTYPNAGFDWTRQDDVDVDNMNVARRRVLEMYGGLHVEDEVSHCFPDSVVVASMLFRPLIPLIPPAFSSTIVQESHPQSGPLRSTLALAFEATRPPVDFASGPVPRSPDASHAPNPKTKSKQSQRRNRFSRRKKAEKNKAKRERNKANQKKPKDKTNGNGGGNGGPFTSLTPPQKGMRGVLGG